MSATASDTAKSRMERILRLHEQIDEIKADIRDIYAEEKADGGDKTAMGAAISYIRKREKDSAALADREAMADVYLAAFDAPRVHTHARERIPNPTVTPAATTPAASVGNCEDGAGSDASPFYSGVPAQDSGGTETSSESQPLGKPNAARPASVDAHVNDGRQAGKVCAEVVTSRGGENPAPLSPIGAPHPPGAADKTGAASSLPVAPVAQSDDELKPNPHCQKAKRGEMCDLAYSMANCWRCADAAMRAKEAA